VYKVKISRSNAIKHAYKQRGFVYTVELILIAVILVIGTAVGLVAIRDAVSSEMLEFAQVIEYEATEKYAFNGYPSGASAERDFSLKSLELDNVEGRDFSSILSTAGNGGTDPGDPTPTTEPTDPTPPPEPPPFTETGFLVLTDVLNPLNSGQQLSILECITLSTGYNISIVPSLDGSYSGICETFATAPDPSTIPTDIENIVFLDLFDNINGIYTGQVSIAECVARLEESLAGLLYINNVSPGGYGYCQLD